MNRFPFLFRCYCLCLILIGYSVSAQSVQERQFTVERHAEKLLVALDNSPIAEFVFKDDKVLRPYFCNLRLLNGLKVSRNLPPIEGIDALDHESMHPGVWLGLGDINGNDFWRNKARMQHTRFVSEPLVMDGKLTFATECQLQTGSEQLLGLLTNRITLVARPVGWLLIWDSTFQANSEELVFGDQEEMGFGARVASSLTEKNGGRILNSSGLLTAKSTWGQPASWCDYSGKIGDQAAGITLMASPSNFRTSWWHNRDYGVFVANPFGRAAMNQGEKSSLKVPPGQALRLCFGALVHEGIEANFAAEFAAFIDLSEQKKNNVSR